MNYHPYTFFISWGLWVCEFMKYTVFIESVRNGLKTGLKVDKSHIIECHLICNGMKKLKSLKPFKIWLFFRDIFVMKKDLFFNFCLQKILTDGKKYWCGNFCLILSFLQKNIFLKYSKLKKFKIYFYRIFAPYYNI